MNEHITFGLFALYVAVVSLVLVLIGQQDSLLALLRRFWGRSIGHCLYFGIRVALPMLICVLCIGWGIRQYDASTVLASADKPLHLNVDSFRQTILTMNETNAPDPLGIVYGA